MAWFSKNERVSAMLKGFADMHCHVLPGIDDGAPDLDASFALLERYERLGIRALIPTPHVMQGTYPNTAGSIQAALEQLRSDKRWAKWGHLVAPPAAEHMLDEETDRLIASRGMHALSGTSVLVEFSWHQPPIGIESKIFSLNTAGYTPILAHPERYLYFAKMEQFEQLKERGFRFQLNLLSLSDHYGSQVRNNAFKLLKRGWYDYAGTDAHRMVHLERLSDLSIPSRLADPLRKCLQNSTSLVQKTISE